MKFPFFHLEVVEVMRPKRCQTTAVGVAVTGSVSGTETEVKGIESGEGIANESGNESGNESENEEVRKSGKGAIVIGSVTTERFVRGTGIDLIGNVREILVIKKMIGNESESVLEVWEV